MITVNPTNPSSDDHIELVFVYPRAAEFVSQTVVGSRFELTVQRNSLIEILPPPANQFSWPLGRLEAGGYTAVLTETTVFPPGVTQTTEAFTVSQGTLPFLHPSPVPVLSIPSLFLLAGAFVWIANKTLNGRRG